MNENQKTTPLESKETQLQEPEKETLHKSEDGCINESIQNTNEDQKEDICNTPENEKAIVSDESLNPIASPVKNNKITTQNILTNLKSIAKKLIKSKEEAEGEIKDYVVPAILIAASFLLSSLAFMFLSIKSLSICNMLKYMGVPVGRSFLTGFVTTIITVLGFSLIKTIKTIYHKETVTISPQSIASGTINAATYSIILFISSLLALISTEIGFFFIVCVGILAIIDLSRSISGYKVYWKTLINVFLTTIYAVVFILIIFNIIKSGLGAAITSVLF